VWVVTEVESGWSDETMRFEHMHDALVFMRYKKSNDVETTVRWEE